MSVATAVDPLCATADLSEKRATARFVCRLNGDCRPVDPLDAGSGWPARATNISRGGINLRVCRRFEPGTLIALQFTSFPAEGAFMPLATVRHVSTDGSHWRLGCTWSRELAGEDLRGLVGRSDVLRKAA
jgi:PilZ domain